MKSPATRFATVAVAAALIAVAMVHFTGRRGLPGASPREPANKTGPPDLEVQLPADSEAARFVEEAGAMDGLEAADALARLPGDLTLAEQDLLLEFLNGDMAALAHLPAARRHHVANDLMAVLARQSERSPDFVDAMGRIIADGASDPVVRDYAVQALGRWLADSLRASDSAESIDAAVTLLLTTADRAEAIGGTAIIALDYIAGERGGVSVLGRRWGQFLEALDLLVADEEAHPFARASAIQVAARRGRPGIAAIARRLAGDREQAAATRASAIAALAETGDPAKDLRRLEELASSTQFQIASAAKSASERLRSRD